MLVIDSPGAVVRMSRTIAELFAVAARIAAFVDIAEETHFTDLQMKAASFIIPIRRDMLDVMGKIPYLHQIQALSLWAIAFSAAIPSNLDCTVSELNELPHVLNFPNELEYFKSGRIPKEVLPRSLFYHIMILRLKAYSMPRK